MKAEQALAYAEAAVEQAKVNLASQQEEVKVTEERIERLKATVAGGAVLVTMDDDANDTPLAMTIQKLYSTLGPLTEAVTLNKEEGEPTRGRNRTRKEPSSPRNG